MTRRGLLKLTALVAVASSLPNGAPARPMEQIKKGPIVERYGWTDDDGNQVVGYRKVWPTTDEYYFHPSKDGGWWKKTLPAKKYPSLSEVVLTKVRSLVGRLFGQTEPSML